MYDAVRFKIPCLSDEDKAIILTRISDVSTTAKSNGFTYHTGKLLNLYIKIQANELFVSGSLNHYYHTESPLAMLSIQDTLNAIIKLENALGICLFNTKLTYLEIGVNMVLNSPPAGFIDVLVELDRYRRVIVEDGIYFKQSNNEIIFYNKTDKEIKSKRLKRNEVKGINILRYEKKYTKELGSQLGEVYLYQLASPDFYNQMLNALKHQFSAIIKIEPRMKQLVPTSKTKEIEQQLIGLYLSDTSILNTVLDNIKDWTKAGKITNSVASRHRTQLKKALQSVANKTKGTKVLELEQAFDEAINKLV